jgi:DNA repair protein RadC
LKNEPAMADSLESTDDLPRERLGRLGARSLSDSELLALVLGHGTPRRSARDIATAILKDVGGIHGLGRTSGSRLARLAGVGEAQASRVLAAVEMGRRTLTVSPSAREPLRTPADIAAFLLPRYGTHAVERFGVLLLDSRHRYRGVHIVSEGTIDAVVALPRDVFREATIAGAPAVVLFHNHPSGDPAPTDADVLLTRRLIDAGAIVGIQVVDHLILADTRYCSLRASQVV